MSVRHPSLWNSLRVLKDQLVVNEAKKNGMLSGNPPPPKKLKWRRLEEGIWKRTTKFNELLEGYLPLYSAICSISIMII